MPLIDPSAAKTGREAVLSVLADENWPAPGWLDGSKNEKDRAQPTPRQYEDYLTRQLRTRYLDLENDFRSVYGNFGDKFADHVTASRIASLLHITRPALESNTPDHFTIASTLDQVDRYLVWIYPPHVGLARAIGLLGSLGEYTSTTPEKAISSMMIALELAIKEKDDGATRSCSDEAVRVLWG